MNDPSRQNLVLAWTRSAGGGDLQAERELVQALTPVIRASVLRTMRRFASRRRAVEQEVEDLTQGVLLVLFARDGGRAIARWDPDRGLALDGFVALLAAHETAAILRSRRRSPWTEEPTQAEALDANAAAAVGPEAAASGRRMIAAVIERVRARVSDRGGELFDLLFLEGRAPEDISALTGLALPVVYAWSSRLSRVGREVAAELEAEPRPAPARRGARARRAFPAAALA